MLAPVPLLYVFSSLGGGSCASAKCRPFFRMWARWWWTLYWLCLLFAWLLLLLLVWLLWLLWKLELW